MNVFQKDNINFALYNCNWIEKNITFKKLLLLAMQINNAEKLKLKASEQIIVNLQLFTNVIIRIIICIFRFYKHYIIRLPCIISSCPTLRCLVKDLVFFFMDLCRYMIIILQRIECFLCRCIFGAVLYVKSVKCKNYFECLASQ